MLFDVAPAVRLFTYSIVILFQKVCFKFGKLLEWSCNVLETWIDQDLCSKFEEVDIPIMHLFNINHPRVIGDSVKPSRFGVATLEQVIVIATKSKLRLSNCIFGSCIDTEDLLVN